MCTQGGKDANGVIKNVLPRVIARPVLAENMNCGGATKGGSVLPAPKDPKRNIMGTKFQVLLEKACQRVQPDLTPRLFKTLLSEYLKRSSSMKGGAQYKLKHPSSTHSDQQ